MLHRGALPGVDAPAEAEGIADAIVVIDDHPDIQPRASGSEAEPLAIPVDPGFYKLVVHAKGYRDAACGGEMGPVPADVEVDCLLEPALVRSRPTKNSVQFPVDKANILPESERPDRESPKTLIKNPRIKRVEVQGRTNSSGNDEYNLVLCSAPPPSATG